MNKRAKQTGEFSFDSPVVFKLSCGAPGWPWAVCGPDNEPIPVTPTRAAHLLQAAVGKRKAMAIIWRWVAESELEQLEVANDNPLGLTGFIGFEEGDLDDLSPTPKTEAEWEKVEQAVEDAHQDFLNRLDPVGTAND